MVLCIFFKRKEWGEWWQCVETLKSQSLVSLISLLDDLLSVVTLMGFVFQVDFGLVKYLYFYLCTICLLINQFIYSFVFVA